MSVTPADPDERPPSQLAKLHELGALAPRVWRGFGHLGPRGPDDGPRCLVIPGFVATDRTSMELRRAFAEGGWRTHGWNMGLNKGARPDILQVLLARLRSIGEGQPVLLVGWSLGGVFARELARECPDEVSAVVSLGSPFSGDPRWNNVWRLYEWVAGHPVDRPPIERSHAKPPVPTLALWSRRDGIVAPRAAYGLPEESDCAVEIGCSHMGFAVGRSGTRRVVAETRAFLSSRGIAVP
ncbi:alpha/beta hydrolase [Sphingomonas sp. GCM10030256]|uniref:alpha/beta hydrolase n=1 Tax=Sphingomonas sp. GCM10030256 TaxID=3273427 RepID=UPI003614204E